MPRNINDLERRQAKKDGAQVVKNSGRGMNKGDATLEEIYMVDYKFTEAKSFQTNLEKFKALEKQAWREGKNPIVVTIFRSHGDRAIAMIDWDVLQELIKDE